MTNDVKILPLPEGDFDTDMYYHAAWTADQMRAFYLRGWNDHAALPASADLTHEMLDAGMEALKDSHNVGQWGECGGFSWGDARACWLAMEAVRIAASKETSK